MTRNNTKTNLTNQYLMLFRVMRVDRSCFRKLPTHPHPHEGVLGAWAVVRLFVT